MTSHSAIDCALSLSKYSSSICRSTFTTVRATRCRSVCTFMVADEHGILFGTRLFVNTHSLSHTHAQALGSRLCTQHVKLVLALQLEGVALAHAVLANVLVDLVGEHRVAQQGVGIAGAASFLGFRVPLLDGLYVWSESRKCRALTQQQQNVQERAP